MILFAGTKANLRGLSWHTLEINNESSLRELSAAMADSDADIEVFLPLSADKKLTMGEYIFARAADVKTLRKLKSARGVQGILCSERLIKSRNGDEPSVIETPITIPDEEIQVMIAKARAEHEQRRGTIQAGAFARVIDGILRNYCGAVIQVEDSYATVKIELLTKVISLRTPVNNLTQLDIPKPLQRFFYSAPIQHMVDDDEASIALIEATR